MAPPDHQQLGMARANVFFEASLFSSATGGDVRPPHMRINDVVGTSFARLPIGCPADPPALARLVQVNLDRSVLADRLFVDPIYEHHPCACASTSIRHASPPGPPPRPGVPFAGPKPT